MRKPIIAGNWKMNKTASEGAQLVNELKPLVKDANCDVVVCVPAIDIPAVAEAIKGSNIQLGAQNVHFEPHGAFTGEISADMLKEYGVKYVIVGHSERRTYFNDTDETVNKRMHAALNAGITPIVCLGETLEQRQTGKTEAVLDEQIDDALFLSYAEERAGRKVELTRPKFGIRRELLDMAEGNAKEYLEKSISAIQHKNDMTVNACERLKTLLRLSRYPKRMECYDISNVSGVDKVGSMVVFTDGEADKYEYRRFRIRTVEGANDFASLQEVLRRRLAKLGTEEEERFAKPQLIVIDGGKGQLSSVKAIFDELGVSDIDLVALAKQEEEVYTLWQDEPVRLDRRDYALRTLQRIRDEAHRFAVTYFRNLHSKRNLASVLEEIEGVGKSKRAALQKAFGTIDRIMRAAPEELARVEGIGPQLAARIHTYFEEL